MPAEIAATPPTDIVATQPTEKTAAAAKLVQLAKPTLPRSATAGLSKNANATTNGTKKHAPAATGNHASAAALVATSPLPLPPLTSFDIAPTPKPIPRVVPASSTLSLEDDFPLVEDDNLSYDNLYLVDEGTDFYLPPIYNAITTNDFGESSSTNFLPPLMTPYPALPLYQGIYSNQQQQQ